MTMPPIADVKAAAELFSKYPIGTGIHSTAEFERFSAARELLARFGLAVLNAPGMSAERLQEVQLNLDNECTAGREETYFDAEELLAEVLRLRAERAAQ